MLESFRPLYDDAVVVMALGSNEDDGTAVIAANWGATVSRYENQIHPEWDGVDDFAAARNRAWQIGADCGADWLLWADTDDVITPEACALLREACVQAMEQDMDIVACNYAVPQEGVKLMRERLARPGRARWMSRIHEHLGPMTDEQVLKVCEVPNAEVIHSPAAQKSGSLERNLRILEDIPARDRTASHHFHMFNSLLAAGRTDEMMMAGMQFLQAPSMGQAERYEVLMQMGLASTDIEVSLKFALSAYAEDPARREALGELSHMSIRRGDCAAALAYSTAMMSLPDPPQAPWALRRSFWGVQGLHIHTRALRLNGRPEEAEAREYNHFRAHGGGISLLHATRCRPAMALNARRLWYARAENPDAVEHIFAVDADDDESAALRGWRHVVVQPGGGCVRAWNSAAGASEGNVLVQMSDDFEPPMGWDRKILDRLEPALAADGEAVLHVSDGHRTDDLMCIAILTRKRWARQGYLFHPQFLSMHSDAWFSAAAYRDGVVIPAPDLVFHHRHPFFCGAPGWDSTYAESNSPERYNEGAAVFDRLRRGVPTSHEIIGYCDFADYYSAVADRLQDGDIFVEVGSFLGQSIIHLAQTLQDRGKHGVRLVCVDTFLGEPGQPEHSEIVAQSGGSIREAFAANILRAEVACMIEIREADSAASAAAFADAGVAGVFIDAAHDYTSVARDIAAWSPKVRPGGFLAGHDYPWHEVARAVTEHAIARGVRVRQIGRVWETCDKSANILSNVRISDCKPEERPSDSPNEKISYSEGESASWSG